MCSNSAQFLHSIVRVGGLHDGVQTKVRNLGDKSSAAIICSTEPPAARLVSTLRMPPICLPNHSMPSVSLATPGDLHKPPCPVCGMLACLDFNS